MKTRLLGVLALVLVPACAFAVDGQVLINPKTVTFPYHITQPGSYKLTGNLTISLGVDTAISIDSDNVTLDLNGFTISGDYKGAGVFSSSQNVTVRNGVLANLWDGIGLGGSGLVADLQILNVFHPMSVKGYVVVRCKVHGIFEGIYAENSTLSDVISNGGGWSGITVRDSIVVNSTANGNTWDGFDATNSTLSHNVANNNGRYGIYGSGTLFGGNTLLNNGIASVNGTLTSQGNNLCSTGLC